ncbi:MAG: protein kinase [Planctomycetes bacterium]|nr:protein kinase [Planctomycetota bacterium]
MERRPATRVPPQAGHTTGVPRQAGHTKPDDGARPQAAARPGERIDDYVVGSPLGDGLTGSTFLAARTGRDGHLRQVALKLCDPARGVVLPWAARLEDDLDPRVVRYEAVGPATRRWSGYWVTDVLRGEPLDDVVAGAGFARRLRAALDVAEAVAALHARGLVHGHLLPHNVLVRRERADALAPVVTDVGVRLRLDPAVHGAPGVAARLYPFLAPEALDALADDPARVEAPADVYSLGALLCALLTGLGPGLAEGERTGAEIARSKARRAYTVGALLEPDEPVDLERVNDLLQRALAPRPGDRPTAGGVAEALRAALLIPEPALP